MFEIPLICLLLAIITILFMVVFGASGLYGYYCQWTAVVCMVVFIGFAINIGKEIMYNKYKTYGESS